MESAKLELLKKDLEAIGFFEWIQWCVCWRKQCIGDVIVEWFSLSSLTGIHSLQSLSSIHQIPSDSNPSFS